MKGQVKICFGQLKIEVLNKLESRGFRATSLSTYDFSTLYTTLLYNLIKEKLINLIEWTFKREGSPYVHLILPVTTDSKRVFRRTWKDTEELLKEVFFSYFLLCSFLSECVIRQVKTNIY